MKQIYLLLLTFLLAGNLRAQMPNGSIAPDWTLTDINGNTYNLYSYLDQGITVFIDFSATWCGPCWNYHNTHALRDLYDQYGPDGTGEVMVFFIEGDASTSLDCLYGNTAACPSTQGNWVAGTTYPIINDHSQNGPYQISFYPTIYGICPNKRIQLLGQMSAPVLYNFAVNCATLSYTSSHVNIPCYGEGSGSIELEVTSGIPPYSYSWSNGSNSRNLSGLNPGTYTCTITANNGNIIVTDPIVITQPASEVQGGVDNVVPENCYGNNGTIEISSSGGYGSHSYRWNTGANTRNLSNLRQGSYSVTITDLNNCNYSIENITVDKVEFPEATAYSDGFIDCTLPSIILDGSGSSTGPQYSYLWTTTNGNIVSGETTLNPEIDQPGQYTLIVTDNTYGCDDRSTVDVPGSINPPNVNAGTDRVIPCGQSQLILDATNGSNSGNDYTIQWTTQNGQIISGGNTLTPTVSGAGTYTLRIVSLLNGCEATDHTVVSQGTEISLSVQEQAESCHGQANGSATVTAGGGTAPFSYTWSNGATTATVTGLASGIYTVTVADAGGCSSVTTVAIDGGVQITATSNVTGESEQGAADGRASVSAAGGTGPYSYSWSNGATGQEATGLTAGIYTVTVTDANGCKTIITVVVNSGGCAMSASAADVSPANCHGSADGSAEIEVLNNNGSVKASWSDGGEGLVREDLKAGTYTVIVEDEAGCPSSVTIHITEPAPITFEVVRMPVFECAQETEETQTLTIRAEGGTGAITYLWENGANDTSIEVPYGEYTIYATDANGCVQSFTVTTVATDDIKPTVIAQNIEVYLDEEGRAPVSGNMIDHGSFDNCGIASIVSSRSEMTCDNLGNNSVSILVTDTNGNTNIGAATVTVIDDRKPNIVCPDDMIVWRKGGDHRVDYDDPLASDNCTVAKVELTDGLPSGSHFAFGIHSVTFKAVDQSGNEQSCSFTIRVTPYRYDVGYNPNDCLCDRAPVLPLSNQEAGLRNAAATTGMAYIHTFPNPAGNELNIELYRETEAVLQVELLDISGRTVHMQQSTAKGQTNLTIGTAALQSGLYLLRVKDGDCTHVRKVSILH